MLDSSHVSRLLKNGRQCAYSDVLLDEKTINVTLCPKNSKKEFFSPNPDEGEEAESEVPHQLFNVNKASEAIDTVSHFLLEQPNFVEGLEQLNGIYNINVPDL